MKRALILGVGGQDGSYLADILLEKGYEVHGLYRRSSVDNLIRVQHVLDRISLHKGDLTDPISVGRAIIEARPHEVYNEADQDHVGWSYETPAVSMDVTAKAVANLLETVRLIDKRIRVFQPISATVFGGALPPQTEKTPFDPQSPYACAKTSAYYIARYYREVHGLFVCTAFLFNHDSVRRGSGYLLHDLCSKAKAVASGRLTTITVGDPEMVVDIGCAREYMEAVWEMMQRTQADDFILASGTPVRIRAIINEAAAILGIGSVSVVANPSLLRPGKQPTLVGDSSKAQRAFGFQPTRNVYDILHEALSTPTRKEQQ